MLFFGPSASGKGSAALELARSLSCTENAAWNCSCASCSRHRYLVNSDLLMLGPRAFSPEIAAAARAFLREPSAPATRALFIRSLRKLMGRFSPVLLEDSPNLGKVNPLLQTLEEKLEEFETLDDGTDAAKICETLQKDAIKLESEGISDLIPINHIRRAAYWSRLAPNGKRKMLLIENADRMREEARNSLLKLLEEPPATLNIVLTAQRREAIMPTILSRLRPYRFLKRDDEKEREVIRRVFREAEWQAAGVSHGSGGLINAYLETFFSQNTEKLNSLAAYFIASAARVTARDIKKKRGEIPAFIAALGSRYAPIADNAGFEKSLQPKDIIKNVLASSDNFNGRSSSRFLKTILDLVSVSWQQQAHGSASIAYIDIWRKYTAEAETAMNILNQNPALALESCFFRLTGALTNG
jgi:DNA polymerase-3 subunit gamma/tau